MNKPFIIGTRGSKLALYQANLVKSLLCKALPALQIDIEIIKTKGDKILDVPLAKIGDKGLFTKELEVALVEGKIDIAVHSLKDLPTKLPDGICLGAVLERGEVRDVLISKEQLSFDKLPAGAVIGTSSLRRISQVLYARPDLKIVDMRGNVDSRIQKLESGICDAIILAGAGVTRLEYTGKITQFFEPDVMIPAVSQGIIGIEARENDVRVADILATINHPATFTIALAERAFLRTLEGGCQVPLGCITTMTDTFSITGFIADRDGSTMIRKTQQGAPELAEQIAISLAKELYNAGGKNILDRIKNEFNHE